MEISIGVKIEEMESKMKDQMVLKCQQMVNM